MPTMQFMGSAPAKRNYLAEALEGGIESYTGARDKRLDRELKLDTISYAKKAKAAELIMKQTEYATPQQKVEIGKTQAKGLIIEAYGQEVFDTWLNTSGRTKASKLAEVNTMIELKGHPSRFDRAGMRIGKNEMDREIAFKLQDPAWKTTYPSLQAKFEASYTEPKKEKKEGWKWPWGKDEVSYTNLTEDELFRKAKLGDSKAIQEATNRGYMVGGK